MLSQDQSSATVPVARITQVRRSGFVLWRTGGMRSFKFLDDVVLFCVDSDGEVGRQCPGGCRPNCNAGIRQRVRRPRSTDNRKFDVNGGVIALLVFHFGFSEGSLRASAPEDWLLRLIHQALLNKNRERAQDFRFILGIHRKIRVFPVTEHAESLELFALDADEFSREGLAFLANLQRRKLPRFFDHFIFDRKPMTIPARHVRRAFAQHSLRFHHEILEDFVERGPHVHVTVCERRPVMQDK